MEQRAPPAVLLPALGCRDSRPASRAQLSSALAVLPGLFGLPGSVRLGLRDPRRPSELSSPDPPPHLPLRSSLAGSLVMSAQSWLRRNIPFPSLPFPFPAPVPAAAPGAPRRLFRVGERGRSLAWLGPGQCQMLAVVLVARPRRGRLVQATRTEGLGAGALRLGTRQLCVLCETRPVLHPQGLPPALLPTSLASYPGTRLRHPPRWVTGPAGHTLHPAGRGPSSNR